MVQVEGVHAAGKFKSFIIIVKIILVLSGQEDGREHELVDVARAQREAGLAQVVAVDVDDRQDEALGREPRVPVQSAQEVSDRDVGHRI